MSKLLARLLTRSFPGKEPAKLESIPDRPESKIEEQRAESTYESRALALWVEELRKLEGHRVVDFGAISPETLAFFHQRKAQLGVVSLSTPVTQDGLREQLLSTSGEGRFEGALCWDLPNYLGTDSLNVLGEWLADRMTPGGVLMCCMATQTPYARDPARYRIIDESTVRFEQNGEKLRKTRYSSADLLRAWSQFDPLRSFLLRNGMQEYVLRRR